MKRRRKHGLDLLPLLDVFMVVLFVFATIQEGKLGESSEEVATLRARLAAATAEAAAQRRTGAEVEQARAELTQAREAQSQLQAAMQELRIAAERQASNSSMSGAEVLRREDVLARLIDHFSVFEIEIDGELVDGAIVNHCCYRSEPLPTAWKSCGAVPAVTVELSDWLAAGGSGLVESLRRTKGGNAMTIVRQNERATWHIGRKLEEQLRERFTDHKIYEEGVSLHSVACAR